MIIFSYLAVKETYRVHDFHPFHLILVSVTSPQVSLTIAYYRHSLLYKNVLILNKIRLVNKFLHSLLLY